MWFQNVLLATWLLLIPLLAEPRKLDDILKSAGKKINKRFNEYGQFRLSQNIKNRQWQMESAKFERMSDAEVEADKVEAAERLGEKFVHQQSAQNLYYLAFADWLTRVTDKSMTATICGGQQQLTYYQFHKYLDTNRKTWIATAQRNVTYTVKPNTARDTLECAVSFLQTARWGYTTQIVYKMTAKLVMFNEDTHFMIHHVDVLGGCSETGTVDLSQMGVSLTEQEIWKKDTDVQQLFKLFTPGSLEYAHQPEDAVPVLWLEGLERGDRLRATTCHRDGEDGPVYTNEQFRSYWKRFGMMWHPKKDEKSFIQTQILRSLPNEELAARITMSLQSSEFESLSIVNWDMKIMAEFNQRGDNKWYINRVEVVCPPGVDLWKANYDALLGHVKTNFRKMITDSMQWYSALEVIKKYQKQGQLEMESCNKTLSTFEELEKAFWRGHVHSPGTMQSFTMIRDEPTAEGAVFSMKVVLNTTKKARATYVTNWTFYLRWDKMDQFYYIYKASFDCVTATDLLIPCYHKTCSYVDAEPLIGKHKKRRR